MRATILSTAVLCGAILAGPAFADHGGDVDCGDFDTQPEAQAHYRAHLPGDRDRLDADDDGIACEDLPGGIPVGGVDAGYGGAAGERGVTVPGAVLVAGVTLTIVGVRARRRTA